MRFIDTRQQVTEVGALIRQLSEQAAAHVCSWDTVDGLTFRFVARDTLHRIAID
jgi:hypothetical protein